MLEFSLTLGLIRFKSYGNGKGLLKMIQFNKKFMIFEVKEFGELL